MTAHRPVRISRALIQLAMQCHPACGAWRSSSHRPCRKPLCSQEAFHPARSWAKRVVPWSLSRSVSGCGGVWLSRSRKLGLGWPLMGLSSDCMAGVLP